ncbi:MAG TPA: hypothetical protein VKG63_13595 [Steroidobacteraceae bacterium]|nr:hypothetical protein [Steroidobacteraceae bacterium]
MSIQPYIWLISGAIGAAAGAMRTWRLGAWEWFAGLLFGFASGLAVAVVCSLPYVMLLIYVQKNMPHFEPTVIKVFYIPQTLLGMILAWYLPSWCIGSIAGALSN